MDVLIADGERGKLASDTQTGRPGPRGLGRESVMSTWMLKACPRCGGDLFRVQYIEGPAVKCLQCAREWDSLQAALDKGVKTGSVSPRDAASRRGGTHLGTRGVKTGQVSRRRIAVNAAG